MYKGCTKGLKYEGVQIIKISHMTKEELKERYRQFSIRIVKMVNAMPNTIAGNAIARQIVRSGTSPAANYRAACIAKSEKDFINKLKMVEEELDETCHWLSIIIDTDILPAYKVQPLYEEGLELVRITTKSIKSTKSRLEAEERDKLNQ